MINVSRSHTEALLSWSKTEDVIQKKNGGLTIDTFSPRPPPLLHLFKHMESLQRVGSSQIICFPHEELQIAAYKQEFMIYNVQVVI